MVHQPPPGASRLSTSASTPSRAPQSRTQYRHSNRIRRLRILRGGHRVLCVGPTESRCEYLFERDVRGVYFG